MTYLQREKPIRSIVEAGRANRKKTRPVWMNRSENEARKTAPNIGARAPIGEGVRRNEQKANKRTNPERTPKGGRYMTGGDIIAETKRILQDYPKMNIAVLNLTDEIAGIEKELRDESIAAARYGVERVTGGAVGLTPTERAAERRIKAEMRIMELEHQIAAIERRKCAVERALDALDETDREIVRARMAGHSWAHIAAEMNYSEKWAKNKGGKAIREMALMLFGAWSGATPPPCEK